MKTATVHRPCRACQCPLMLVMGPSGQMIPLDTRALVYTVSKDLLGEDVCERAPESFVSHFATCPSASQFSKKGRP